MNKLLYKITAWILITAGIIWTLANIWINGVIYFIDFAHFNIGEVLFGGLLGSIGILILFLLPSITYLKIKENEQNKLTNASVILTFIGIILVLITFVVMMMACPPRTNICDGWGIMIVFYGIFPAASLYVIAVILLLINKFKNNFIKLKNMKKTTIAIIIIAIVIVTALIVGGGIYVWQKSNLKLMKQNSEQQVSVLQEQINQLQQTEKISEPSNPEKIQGYKLINGRCTKEECLFNKNNSDYPIGTATVKGYYTKFLDQVWDEEKYCDSLTVTNGTQELIDSLISLVDGDNTIHDKNELNQPIVNFNISNLNEDSKQKFLSSTKDNPVELVVFQQEHIGRAVRVCFNMFEILEVK